MKKRTIIILSLLSAVISLIYVVCVYFGITRYFSLHFYPPENYSKDYRKLEKAHDKNRVVVSIDSKGERGIKPTLNSLLDQTVKVDEIAISLPYGKGEDVYKDIVKTYRFSVKYGEVSYIVPVLLREESAETCIIGVKDDMVYGKDFIESLMDEINKTPNEAIFVGKEAFIVKAKFFDEKVANYDGICNCTDWIKKNLKVKYRTVKYSEIYKKL